MLARALDRSNGRPRSRLRLDGGRSGSTLRYYDDHAAAYAATTMAIDTSERLERFASMLPAGARVLDAGCGSGRDLAQLRASGFDPLGLDVSVELAGIARRISGCEVMVGDLRTVEIPACSFGGVWAMASLLHLEREELPDVLASLATMLEPRGVLFASVKRGSGEVVDDTGRWFTLYDEDAWAEHLREAGLEVIEVVGEPAGVGGSTGTVAPGWISSLARRP